jgi:hypothetical protein
MQIVWLKCNNLSHFLNREEIQRIKTSNPEISHREAFSAAAKNVSLAWLFFWITRLIFAISYIWLFGIVVTDDYSGLIFLDSISAWASPTAVAAAAIDPMIDAIFLHTPTTCLATLERQVDGWLPPP